VASRLSRHLLFRSPSAGTRHAPQTPAPADAVPVHDPPLAPRDEAVFLLNLAAEVEHALMVQYLFAAYSLREPGQLAANQAALVRAWREAITMVAREEMGHLITVQNLLRCLGAPLSLARDEFPVNSGFYPFAFRLERAGKNSIAKYAFAEMPTAAIAEGVDGMTAAEVADITRRADEDNTGQPVNRVGKLYERLMAVVRSLPVSDFSVSSVSRQAQFDEWGLAQHDLLIFPVGTRTQALAALSRIAEQGEGPLTAAAAANPESHFQRFVSIYRQIPDDGSWQPAIPVVENPNVRTAAAGQPNPGEITQPEARLWAQLFNARYRRLLMTLQHALAIEAPAPTGLDATPRGLLISWSFGEMYHLRSLANLLTRLPTTADPGQREKAGAPFEMPSSLTLPPLEADRWRLQSTMLQSAGLIVASLTALPATAGVELLQGMAEADAEAIQIATRVASQ
jgi:ferritin-like protein